MVLDEHECEPDVEQSETLSESVSEAPPAPIQPPESTSASNWTLEDAFEWPAGVELAGETTPVDSVSPEPGFAPVSVDFPTDENNHKLSSLPITPYVLIV